MTALIILLGALAVFACVSVILGIVNLLQLSSSASKISYIEAEIDKKTREFDAIKKERMAEATERAQILENPSATGAEPMLEKHDDGSQIEIVRSVRTQDSAILSLSRDTIDHYTGMHAQDLPPSSQSPVPHEAYQPFAPAQPQAGYPSLGPSPFGTPPQPVIPSQSPPEQLSAANPYGSQQSEGDYAGTQFGDRIASGGGQNDVLEVVNERGRLSISPEQQYTSVLIPLYSQTSRDADYHTAWQIMSETVQRVPHPYFLIDFNGIIQITKRELGYLEHFAHTAAQYGGYMALVNCQPQVAAVIQANPTLAPLVQYQ